LGVSRKRSFLTFFRRKPACRNALPSVEVEFFSFGSLACNWRSYLRITSSCPRPPLHLFPDTRGKTVVVFFCLQPLSLWHDASVVVFRVSVSSPTPPPPSTRCFLFSFLQHKHFGSWYNPFWSPQHDSHRVVFLVTVDPPHTYWSPPHLCPLLLLLVFVDCSPYRLVWVSLPKTFAVFLLSVVIILVSPALTVPTYAHSFSFFLMAPVMSRVISGWFHHSLGFFRRPPCYSSCFLYFSLPGQHPANPNALILV